MGVRKKENPKLSRLHHDFARSHLAVLQRTQSPADARRYTKAAGAKL